MLKIPTTVNKTLPFGIGYTLTSQGVNNYLTSTNILNKNGCSLDFSLYLKESFTYDNFINKTLGIKIIDPTQFSILQIQRNLLNTYINHNTLHIAGCQGDTKILKNRFLDLNKYIKYQKIKTNQKQNSYNYNILNKKTIDIFPQFSTASFSKIQNSKSLYSEGNFSTIQLTPLTHITQDIYKYIKLIIFFYYFNI